MWRLTHRVAIGGNYNGDRGKYYCRGHCHGHCGYGYYDGDGYYAHTTQHGRLVFGGASKDTQLPTELHT